MGNTLYIKGADGKLQGSRPTGGKTPPTAADVPATPVDSDPPLVTDDLAAVYDAYQSTVDDSEPALPGWLTQTPKGDFVLDPDACAESLLAEQHPAVLEAMTVAPVFDEQQRQALLAAQLGRSSRGLPRNGVDPYAQADETAWREWCEDQAMRLEESDPHLAEEYRRWAEADPRPTELEFDTLKKARYQAVSAAKSLDREMRTIAGYHDTTPGAVTVAFRRLREEYLAMPEDDRPEVPEWHTRGVTFSYFGRDSVKTPPTDPATQYALYAALTDPNVTSQYVRSTRGYVVFDTETTGVENDAAILQVTAVAYDDLGREVDRVSTYVHPGFQEDGTVYTGEEQAVATHGITAETLEGAPPFGDVAPKLHELMDGRTLIAHNLMFDYPKVQRAFANSGHEVLASGAMVDTLRLARWTQPNPGVPNKEWKHNLQTACERAGVDFDSTMAHDAEYDVDRTAALFFALRRAPLGRQYPKPTPPDSTDSAN